MNPQGFLIEVECRVNASGEAVPWHFFIVNREVMVVELLDVWPAEDYRYFKLRGDDEAIYLLRHDIPHDEWELIMFDSGKREETRLSST
jgi:hypothetical protein